MSVPLLLVDGHNLLFRACYGTPAHIYSRDADQRQELTTQFMFFALLRKAINDELGAWPEVVVAFDGQHGADGRQQADAGYKANRPAAGDAPAPILALPDVKTGLDVFGITWIEIDDAEADDVIGTITAGVAQRDVLILSSDQDYCQLVRRGDPESGQVTLLNPAARSGRRWISPADVQARYGVEPGQFCDLRAICGDASDNIPGVRGVGARTAAALLAGGLHLEDLPDSGRLIGAKGATIRATWDQVLGWRSIIRMRTDLLLPLWPTGQRTVPLPRPAEVITKLGLWWRTPPAVGAQAQALPL
jgi:DNA polymerase-1